MPRTASPPRPRAATNGVPDHHDFGGNRATARMLLILSQFGHDTGSHGVSELSRELGMTKNMIHRALKTLTRNGYLVRDESGTRYQLGPGVLQLGRLGLEPLNLPVVAAPYMQRMQELTDETVSLAVRTGRTVVTIAGLRGRGDIARRVPFGRFVPLHASPASRAILACLPDAEIETYLADGPLERYTATTVTDPEAIWAEVHQVRAEGYARGRGDHVRGATGAAFPILASDGTPHGSITIAGPDSRLPAERLDALVPELLQVAAELNRHTQLYPAEPLTQPTPKR